MAGRMVVLFSCVYLGAACHPGFAQDWSVYVVDSTGTRPSIVVDSEDRPGIAYFRFVDNPGPRYTDSTLVKYAAWDTGTGQFLAEPTLVASVNLQASIAIDQNDDPHFFDHRHHPYGDPIHTYREGDVWVHESIESEGHDGFSNSVALDDAGGLHVSFIDATSFGKTQRLRSRSSA